MNKVGEVREVEVKIPLEKDERTELERRLKDYGTYIGKRVEEDFFFKHPNLLNATKILKLRKLNNSNEGSLIFKLKKLNDKLKDSIEFEVKIDKVDVMMRVLEFLGFEVLGKVKKTRTTYFVDNAYVHIDEIEGLGVFIEIEVLTSDKEGLSNPEDVIKRVLLKLGLNDKKMICSGYLEMLKGG